MDPYLPPDYLDLDNPYAPPKSAFAPQAAPRPSGGIPFTVSDVFNWSWAIFGERMLPCICIFWGVVGINFGFSVAMQMALGSLSAVVREPAVLLVIYYVVGIVVQVWLGIGMNRGLLKVARREPVSVDVIFTGGRSLLTTILAGIVVWLIIVGSLLIFSVGFVALGLLMRHTEALIALFLFMLGCGLGAVLLLYLSSRLMQFYYLVIDRDLGVFESIQLSWQLTRGRAGTIILVYMLQICVSLAGFLACCVGVIFAWPLSSLLTVVTYLALSEPAKPADRTPPIVWVDEP